MPDSHQMEHEAYPHAKLDRQEAFTLQFSRSSKQSETGEGATMRMFDVQGIEIVAPRDRVFVEALETRESPER